MPLDVIFVRLFFGSVEILLCRIDKIVFVELVLLALVTNLSQVKGRAARRDGQVVRIGNILRYIKTSNIVKILVENQLFNMYYSLNPILIDIKKLFRNREEI